MEAERAAQLKMEQDNLDNGIVVYCTKGNVMFNSSGELVENIVKVRRNKTSRNTYYQVFLDMIEFTTSEFWTKILQIRNCMNIGDQLCPQIVHFLD